jgi:hypothetical protein
MSFIPNKMRRSLILGGSATAGTLFDASAAILPSGSKSTSKQRFFFPGTTLPVAEGKLYTYEPGSSALKITYKDFAGQRPNTNPIVLDSAGFASIHWDAVYKIVLEDSSGKTFYKIDNYLGSPEALFRLYTPEGSALVGFQGDFLGARPRTAMAKLSERVSVADFLDTLEPTASQATAALQRTIFFRRETCPHRRRVRNRC